MKKAKSISIPAKKPGRKPGTNRPLRGTDGRLAGSKPISEPEPIPAPIPVEPGKVTISPPTLPPVAMPAESTPASVSAGASSATTTSPTASSVASPATWNHPGGPDFSDIEKIAGSPELKTEAAPVESGNAMKLPSPKQLSNLVFTASVRFLGVVTKEPEIWEPTSEKEAADMLGSIERYLDSLDIKELTPGQALAVAAGLYALPRAIAVFQIKKEKAKQKPKPSPNPAPVQNQPVDEQEHAE